DGCERYCAITNVDVLSRCCQGRLPIVVVLRRITGFSWRRYCGHIARDSTAIEAREKALKPQEKAAAAVKRYRRGRPRKDELRPPSPPTRLERQAAGMSLG